MSESIGPEDTGAANTSGGDDLLAGLVDDFLRRHRAGECPSVDEYTSKHPNLASRILELFPLTLAMEQRAAGATPEGATLTERAGGTIGRYKLLERIGEGGFGVVYMAEQFTPVRRKVALKVIKPGVDTRQVIARFEAERQALAMMEHENIARVLDAGATDSGRPYFVMELVHGVPITEFCDKNQLPPRQRLELFVQVCRAVQHAHTKGIIHRDIKPTNVLVTLHEGVAVPKVIDFGVAKATGQQLTEKTLFTNFAQMIGTPLYMSPEQAELTGVDIDTRSDIYSLGVLLYELLTGTTPLDSERLKQSAFDEVRRIIREEEAPRPSTRLSTMGEQAQRTISAQRQSDPKQLGRIVRGELDWIVMRALEKERSRRYETANGLARDIERYLQDEPVEACPPSRTYRFRKFARRYRTPLRFAVSFTALLITATVFSTLQAVLTRRAYTAARASEATAVLERRSAELRQAELFALQGERLASSNGWAQAPALFEEATRLLAKNGVEPDGRFLAARGKAYARASRFQEAAADFSRLMDTQPQDLQNWHQGMPLLLQIGDLEGFRRRRTQVLRQFASSSDATATQTIPKDCFMLPIEGDELRQALAIADRAAPSSSPAWYWQMKGLAEFRGGHFQTAIVWFTESVGSFAPRTAAGHFFLAMSYDLLGDRVRARSELAEGISVMDKSVTLTDANFPDWIFCQVARREAESVLATRGITTRPDEASSLAAAETVCRQAVGAWEKLLGLSPDNADYLQELGHSLWRLSEVLAQMHQSNQAESALRRSLQIFESLDAKNRMELGYRQDAARTDRRLGDLLLAVGRNADAIDCYRRARDIFASVRADAPHRSFYYEEFSAAYARYAQVLTAAGRFTEAESNFREAVRVLHPVVSKDPSRSGVPLGLSEISRRLARLLHEQGADDEADALCRAELEFLVKQAELAATNAKVPAPARAAIAKGYHDQARQLLSAQIKDGLHSTQTLQDFAAYLAKTTDSLKINTAWANEIGEDASALERSGTGGQTTVATSRADRVARLTKALERDPDSTQLRIRLVNALNNTGDLNRAIAACSELIANKPDLAEAYIKRGQLYLEQQDLDKAGGDLSRVFELYQKPHVGQAVRSGELLTLGRLCRQYSQLQSRVSPATASELPLKALPLYSGRMAEYERFGSGSGERHDPWEFAIAYEEIGAALQETKELPAAQKVWLDTQRIWLKLVSADQSVDYRFHLAFNYDALAEIARQSGRSESSVQIFRQALEIWQKLAAKTGSDDHRHHVTWTRQRLAEVLRSQGKAAEAATILAAAEAGWREAIRLHPDDPELHRSLADVLRDQGELDRAIAAYSEVIARKPTDQGAWKARGACYVRKGDLAKAAAYFTEAIAQKPDDWWYWNERAYCYLCLGHYEKAIADQSRSIALNDTEAEQRVRRGTAYQALRQWHEAEIDFTRAIELSPQSWRGWFERARVYHQEHEPAKAGSDLASAANVASDPVARNDLAWHLATDPDPSWRNPKLAVELAERAVAGWPNAGGVWNTVGVARCRNEQWKDAIVAFNKSMELRNGGNPADWYFLAMCYWQLGEKDAAREWFDRGDRWMAANRADSDEMREMLSFRAEAAQLMHISLPATTQTAATAPSR